MFRNPGAFAGRAVPVLMLLIAAFGFALPGSAEAFAVSGEVSFEGVTSSPYPEAKVALLQPGTSTVLYQSYSSVVDGSFEIQDVVGAVYDVEVSAPCWEPQLQYNLEIFAEGEIGPFQLMEASSSFSTITLVGAFNSWNTGAPPMAFDGSCTWSDTLSLDAGTYLFKFVTDGAFDNDYGGVQTTTLDIPGGPFWAIPGVAGEGTAISIQATVTGDYRFTLNEAAQSWTAEYLGVIPEGALYGTVSFEGVSEGPYQAATVQLLTAGTSTVVRSTTSDPDTREFSFTTVADGTYDVKVIARCFADGLESGVVIAGGEENVGDIMLATGTSSFTSISLVGQFSGWDIGGSPSMTQDETCVWSASIPLTAGEYYFKLVTDGAFDNDYGGNELVILTAPGTFTVLPGVSGGNAIRMNFPYDDTFTFTLDEEALTLKVTGTVPVERTSWGAIKARY